MKRNIQLDFWRGFLLLIIVIDHFFSEKNIIRQLTDGFVGWVSAAEGFVFLSGLTAGLVYTYKFTKQEEKQVANSVIKRAWVIYKYHLALFLISMLILMSSDFHHKFWITHYQDVYNQPLLSLISYLGLVYQPRYFDILPMYAFFLLLVPITIKQFYKGNHLSIIAISTAIYLPASFNFFAFLSNIAGPINQVYFNLLSWQLLFFIGLWVGFLMYHQKIDLGKHRNIFYLALAVSITLFILKTFQIEPETHFFSRWTYKGDLRPLRLLNVASIIFTIAFITSRFKNYFTFKPICVLGKYSLEVYSAHILLIMIFKPFRPYLNSLDPVMITNKSYFFPYTSVVLFFVIIPALYAFPLFKSKLMNPNRLAGLLRSKAPRN